MSDRLPDAPSALLHRLCTLLDEAGCAYSRTRHAPGHTTAALAALRGLPVGAGVKALVMKGGADLVVVALRADRALDNRALRRALGVKRLRFARPAELLACTGCVPGQVPPWGPPLFDLPLLADHGVVRDDPRVAFTAGTHTDSFVLATATWQALARPRLADICLPRAAREE